MGENYQEKLVGVFGFPVAENPTCVMQNAAFEAAGLKWRYLTIEVKPEGLKEAVRGVKAMGFAGINLTIPHKVAVMPLLDGISKEATLIGAVNTVWREGERFIGENTDGKGFLIGVKEDAGMDPRGKRVVLLGAGGAARAIGVELALAGAAEIVVYNRGVDRGTAMVGDLVSRTGAKARFERWGSPVVVGKHVDILVNATSIGLFPDVEGMPAVSLAEAGANLLVCDVIPNPPETRLMREARGRGLKTLNGLSMLVHQGAIGFKLWTKREGSKVVMKRALEQAFGIA